ncbi:hypothetical protein LCGC14_2488850, partial [marine sediment metagenome]
MITSRILNKLRNWMCSKAWVYKTNQKYILGDSPEKYRIFIDRGSDILFTAHLDTVLTPKYIKSTKKNVWAVGLDDRLGCDVATVLGEELGADVLLCDHEESGKSTAYHHDLKEYNWIAEFDREGDDVVTYDLDSYAFNQVLLKYWNIGFGSYSDIADLPTTACCFNLGIGYQHAHSKDSYVDLKILKSQIEKFMVFYEKYSTVKFVA